MIIFHQKFGVAYKKSSVAYNNWTMVSLIKPNLLYIYIYIQNLFLVEKQKRIEMQKAEKNFLNYL